MAAKNIVYGNRVHMLVGAGDTTLYFPVEKVKEQDGKTILTVQGDDFQFHPEQKLDVLETSLQRDQLRAIHKIDEIIRTGHSTKNKMTERTYEGWGLGEHLLLKDEIVVVRDQVDKSFSFGKWPEWMPPLTPDFRHSIFMAKSWPSVENLLAKLTGATVKSGNLVH